MSDPERVRQRQRTEWSAVAPGWQRFREKLGAPTGRITERMVELAGIRPGFRVLDLACGAGDPALTIAQIVGSGGYVLGLDLSQEMVRAARAEARQQNITNAGFRAIRSELEPGVPAGSFDAATCRLGLMFMPDPAAALRELHRALRPGARVAVSTWGRPERNPNFSIPLEIIGRHAGLPPQGPMTPGLFALPTPGHLEAVLRAAGFEEVEVEVLRTPAVRARDAETFWRGVSTVAAPIASILDSLTGEQRRRIREDALATLGEIFPDGPVELEGEAVLGAGRRRAPAP